MLTDLSDEALMGAYLEGNSSAFELIYARYSKKVMTYLRRKLRSSEEQDEVFQLVFLKFHNSRRSYDSTYPLLQWIYVITRSVFLDYLKQVRRNSRINEALSLSPQMDKLSQNDTLESLEEPELLSVLSGDQKEIIRQRVLDETTYEEIAKRLDLTESNVRQIFSRALKKLRSMDKYSPGRSK